MENCREKGMYRRGFIATATASLVPSALAIAQGKRKRLMTALMVESQPQAMKKAKQTKSMLVWIPYEEA